MELRQNAHFVATRLVLNFATIAGRLDKSRDINYMPQQPLILATPMRTVSIVR